MRFEDMDIDDVERLNNMGSSHFNVFIPKRLNDELKVLEPITKRYQHFNYYGNTAFFMKLGGYEKVFDQFQNGIFPFHRL